MTFSILSLRKREKEGEERGKRVREEWGERKGEKEKGVEKGTFERSHSKVD